MYKKAEFVADEESAFAIIAAHPLAQLIVATADGLKATPVPLVRRSDALVGHVARPNDIWQHPGDALAIFTGVDTYVSPNWYPSKAEHGKVVPTWNYTTAHVRGTLRVHDDDEWKLEVVTYLTDHFETMFPAPWQVSDAPEDYIAASLKRIVGIELVDITMEGKRKLSQNQPEANYDSVRTNLSAGNPAQQAVAREM